MAANKFATMLHRNTNKMTLVLMYAILEWILIVLLLLSSLFSYLIVKFADYFGLKRPCLWCSRLDHIFEPGNNHTSYRDLVCEQHASEISKLGFCSNHQKLVEAQDMCEDCSDCHEWSNKDDFFPWMKQLGDYENLKCSCCSVSLSNKLYPSCILLKPSWGVLDYAQKPVLTAGVGVDAHTDDGDQSDHSRSDFVTEIHGDEEGGHEENRAHTMVSDVDGQRDYEAEVNSECSVCDYACKEILGNQNEELEGETALNASMVGADGDMVIQERCDAGKANESVHQHLEFYIDQDDCRLVPVDLIDLMDSPTTIGKQSHQSYRVEEDQLANGESQDVILDFDMQFETETKPVVECWHSADEAVTMLSSHECMEESKDAVFNSKNSVDSGGETEVNEAVAITPATQTSCECMEESKDAFLNSKNSVVNGGETEVNEAVAVTPATQTSCECMEESKDAVLDSKNLVDNGGETEVNEAVAVTPATQTSCECVEESKDAVLDSKNLVDNGGETEVNEAVAVTATQTSCECTEESKDAVLDSSDLGDNGRATPSSCHEDESKPAKDVAREESVSDLCQATEEDDMHVRNDDIDGEVSIGTDIPDHEMLNDGIQSTDELLHSYLCAQEDYSTSIPNVDINCDNHGSRQEEEDFLEFKTLSIETSGKARNSYFSLGSKLNEIEEEKTLPDTPTSTDSFHHMYKRMLLSERKETGAEDSLDGSVMSDVECNAGVLTMEKLKAVLRAERRALNRVYAELEEERSASAIAANQTMAMINRLQEEKAAMQMEALQYQRMMDEQSEYDQEAMQLLNELMVKREKEKQELEKELELCRKKVQDYEAREKMMILRRFKDGCTRSRNSSGPCSNAEDSDGLSIDLNNEDSFSGHEESSNQNTPTDAVQYLEESLASFEEEKMSILDQLKELEAKLLTLNDEEEEEHFEDIKPFNHLLLENGNGFHELVDVDSEENGIPNGHSKELNGTHDQDRKIMGSLKAKRLLPLFDAAEAEDMELNRDEEGYDSFASQENMKLAIEEEVDHVYERLQALEADREFLKHCISSLRKGDKGLELLQEILQHLRDLKSVETRLRNSGEGVL